MCLLSVSRSALKRWRQIGRGPYYDLKDHGTDHGIILYNPQELEEWMKRHRGNGD